MMSEQPKEGSLGSKVSRAIKPDAQPFDEIRITTIPRYKMSGLSGDQWRISAKVEFLRNGEVKHQKDAGNINYACNLLSYFLCDAIESGKGYFAGEDDFCDQEGCQEKATVTYTLKKSVCEQCGQAKEKTYQKLVRRFCDKHKRRGDAGLDDADDNYEPL